jgi:hypothetical protein
MRHDWVFDVLRDLKAYAVKNNLPALAARVEDARAVAEAEIAAGRDGPGGGHGQGGLSSNDRAH